MACGTRTGLDSLSPFPALFFLDKRRSLVVSHWASSSGIPGTCSMFLFACSWEAWCCKIRKVQKGWGERCLGREHGNMVQMKLMTRTVLGSVSWKTHPPRCGQPSVRTACLQCRISKRCETLKVLVFETWFGGSPILPKETSFEFPGEEASCFELVLQESDYLQNSAFHVYIDLGSLGCVLVRVTSESHKLRLWISVALGPK